MKKVLGYIIVNLLLLILGLPSISNGQINLVPNSSFEIYDTCPSYSSLVSNPYRSIYYAKPWFQPFIPGNSTEYFNICDTNSNALSVPNNFHGYQVPRTGVGYTGFVGGYITPQNNYREYMEVQLLDTLISGKKYCVSFYVNFSNKSATAIDGLEAYFSQNAVYYISPNFGVLNSLIPQIQNPSGNIISDTLNWVQVYGEFFATGGEKFITIGNFKDDAHTAYIRNIVGASHLYSYYYIDDVSVIYCDTTVGLNEIEWIKNFTISPNPAQNSISLNNLPKNVNDILIYDLQGKILYREKDIVVLQNKHEINISCLSSGVYLVKVVSEGGVVTRKFVKN